MFESSKCCCLLWAPPMVFPHVWREGPEPGQIPGMAVQGLELTATSEKTCPFSQKNALQVFSKNSACWDFPAWHSFGSYDQGQSEPIHLCPLPEPPVESQPLWDPCSYSSCCLQIALDNSGRFVCSAAAWLLPGCLLPPLPMTEEEWLSGEEGKKAGFKEMWALPSLTSITCSHARAGAG